MFVVVVLRDTVPLHPAALGQDIRDALVEQLDRHFTNRVVPNVGLCISVLQLEHIGESMLFPGDARSHVDVIFREIVFRPFAREVIEAKIVGSSKKDGLRLSVEFFSDIMVPPDMLQPGSQFDEDRGTWVWRPDSESGDADQSEGWSDFQYRLGARVRCLVTAVDFFDVAPPSSLKDTGATAGSGASPAEAGVSGGDALRDRRGGMKAIAERAAATGQPLALASMTVPAASSAASAAAASPAAPGGKVEGGAPGASAGSTTKGGGDKTGSSGASGAAASASADKPPGAVQAGGGGEGPGAGGVHRAPMRVTASMADDGLGCVEWWDDAEVGGSQEAAGGLLEEGAEASAAGPGEGRESEGGVPGGDGEGRESEGGVPLAGGDGEMAGFAGASESKSGGEPAELEEGRGEGEGEGGKEVDSGAASEVGDSNPGHKRSTRRRPAR